MSSVDLCRHKPSWSLRAVRESQSASHRFRSSSSGAPTRAASKAGKRCTSGGKGASCASRRSLQNPLPLVVLQPSRRDGRARRLLSASSSAASERDDALGKLGEKSLKASRIYECPEVMQHSQTKLVERITHFLVCVAAAFSSAMCEGVPKTLLLPMT